MARTLQSGSAAHSNLAIQARLLTTIARDSPRNTVVERQARAALVAVVVAIHNNSLDRLIGEITGFLQDELSWTDALTEGEIFDLLSGALIELGMVEADVDELAGSADSDGAQCAQLVSDSGG